MDKIIRIRAEINEIENRKHLKTQNWFFKRKHKFPKIRNERGDITTDST